MHGKVDGSFGVDLAGLSWRLSLLGEVPAQSPHEASALRGVPAVVPGCVHTDLMRAGLIEDPFQGLNEAACQWVSEGVWEYSTTLELPADRPVDAQQRWFLEFEGLQTVAKVLVNDEPVGDSRNMHRRYSFEVGQVLRPGANELRVQFASAVTFMRERMAAEGELPYDWAHPYNQLRIMASSVGWDWGPTLVSAGIWRSARLRSVYGSRLDVSVTTELDSGLHRGALHLDVTLDSPRDGTPVPAAILEVTLGEYSWVLEVPEGRSRHEFSVQKPELWWPSGHGEQVLHDVTVALRDGTDEFRGSVGFRHVEVENECDVHGRSFRVHVNGTPLFIRGVNWIPDDALISRVDSDRYRRRLDMAQEANVNLIRVWGGGVYEGDDFYRLCDERGLLVWQDFMFACAAYPEEEPLRSEVISEADDAVARLSAHPSLILWNGSNESLLGWEDWGWRERVGERTWGEGYYRKDLPDAVVKGAPGIPYIPSSPVSLSPGVHPNAPADGTVHLWDQWNRLDYAHYQDEIPRFVAEFGFQAPANWSTLEAALGQGNVHPDSPVLLGHQKQPRGMDHLKNRLATHFPDPEAIVRDGPQWHAATQLNQAHAIRTAVEHFRSWWPRTAGSIIWQFNDTWPALSWSMVDYRGGRKLSWYALRRAYAERLVAFVPREDGLSLVLINDSAEPWTGSALVRRVHVDGDVRALRTIPFDVMARQVAMIRLDPEFLLPRDRRDELLVADVGPQRLDGSHRAVQAFVADDGIRWRRPALRTAVERPEPGQTTVTVTATTAVTDLCLLVDKLDPDASVDSALVTLMAGESHTFNVRSMLELADHTLTAWPVLISRSSFFHD